jgi:hypothetical protein
VLEEASELGREGAKDKVKTCHRSLTSRMKTLEYLRLLSFIPKAQREVKRLEESFKHQIPPSSPPLADAVFIKLTTPHCGRAALASGDWSPMERLAKGTAIPELALAHATMCLNRTSTQSASRLLFDPAGEHPGRRC